VFDIAVSVSLGQTMAFLQPAGRLAAIGASLLMAGSWLQGDGVRP
jgi:hypothetical protein